MTVDMHTIRAFGSAHRYFQGPGALGLVGELAAGLGKRPLLVADGIVRDLVFPLASQSCTEHGLTLRWVEVHGEVTRPMVRELVARATMNGETPNVVLAAGGGKGVDTGKAVAQELGACLVVLPTSPSNDGPCSRMFVYYDDQHRMVSVERMARNPDAVVVDTSLLVQAPRSLLVSGIGDALCKLYEGNQARGANGLNLFGGRNTIAAEQLCQACDRVIREDAVAGLAALDAGASNEAFERLTEALVLLSGLAFENSGLSLAHSLTRGLPMAGGTASTPHGFHVGYGLLVQFILEERSPSFMREQLAFYRSVGLPVNLRGLGVATPDIEVIRRIADGTMQAPHLRHFQRPLQSDDFVDAMQRLETFTAGSSLSE
jgi:glycerol dehydrogenase